MPGTNHFSAIVRSIGEITTLSIVNQLKNDFDKDKVRVVKDIKPFSQALKESYVQAIDMDTSWTLIVDADVIFKRNALSFFRKAINIAPDNVFDINVRFLDKFFGLERYVGMKIYNTKYLHKAIFYIPESGKADKPETQTIKTMRKQGFQSLFLDYTAGLHDFFQSFEDIFRKGFTHGKKHSKFLHLLMPYWKRRRTADMDFNVLLEGVKLGMLSQKKLELNPDEIPKKIEDVLDKFKAKEKNKNIRYDYVNVSSEIKKKVYNSNRKLLRKSMERPLPGKKIGKINTNFQNFIKVCRKH